MPYDFINLQQSSLSKIFFERIKHKYIHLHTSNIYFRFLMSILCFLSMKKLLITFHGNIGRYTKIKNIFDTLSIYFAYLPIVLNNGSFTKSKSINKKTQIISSFIPPSTQSKLNNEIIEMLDHDRKFYKSIFSTNAYNLSFDKNNKEIYGISQLIDVFYNHSNFCLYISDPSSNYDKYFKSKMMSIPNNVKILNYPHNYFELLKNVDGMIRNTTTDGDALSIKEALFLNKIVLASNTVSRPEGVYTYESELELISLIKRIDTLSKSANSDLSAEKKLIELYSSILK